MKLNKCAIEFHDNPLNVYYSGQTISGIVKVTLIESTKFDCICAKIIGTGYVNWTEKNGESTTTYEDKEIFYDKQIDLIHESHGSILSFFVKFAHNSASLTRHNSTESRFVQLYISIQIAGKSALIN